MHSLLYILVLASLVQAELLSPHAHIFISVSSALRQWGNTLNPNGASFVPGIIRAHTSLYHGRPWASPPNFVDWLAFDAEMSFGITGNAPAYPGLPTDTFMRTYSSTRSIRVGYFDGASAVITDTGTFDFQDFMAYGNAGTPKEGSGIWNEYRRAEKLCNWTKEADLSLDGFVRMNAGFELIVCDWSLWTLVSNVNVTRLHQGKKEAFYEWARSASWHKLVNEARVELDWRKFVSAHGRGILLDPRSSREDRRMISMSNKTLDGLRDMIETALRRPEEGSGLNWQTIVDGIIQRYAPRLVEIHSLLTQNTTNATDLETVGSLVHISLMPYYDHSYADFGLVKCIHGFTWGIETSELSPQEVVIYESILHTLTRICSTLYDLFHSLPGAKQENHQPSSIDISEARTLIQTLVAELSWPSFITCRPDTCNEEQGEFCSLAMWPVVGRKQGTSWPKCLRRQDFGEKWDVQPPDGTKAPSLETEREGLFVAQIPAAMSASILDTTAEERQG